MAAYAKHERTRKVRAVLLKFAPGAVLFNSKHPPKHLMIVRSGVIQIGRADEVIFDCLGRGEICGELCLRPNGPRHLARAINSVTAYSLSGARTIKIVSAKPSLAFHVLKHLLRRMARYEDFINDFVREPTERRLAKLFLRFGTSTRLHGWVQIPNLTNPEIARTIGTTRWQVSHFLSHLGQLGVAKRQEGLWVNFDSLRTFLKRPLRAHGQ